jgi:peptidoglycan hydrolase-like protein with peptidoglycan-binding domain
MSNLLKSKFLLGVMVVATLLVGVVAVNATSASAACSITTTLRVGSKGEQVKCLQTAVGVSADGSFGPKTKAAVIAWQKSMGLVADGVFGAKSRAAFAGGSMGMTYPAGCTSASGFSSTTGMPCTSTSTTLPAGCTSTAGFSPITGASCATGAMSQTGPVQAMLASDNPASGYIIGNQATADLLHVAFTGTGVVNSVTLQRTGVSDQNTLSNVYLYDGMTRLTDGYSFNN